MGGRSAVLDSNVFTPGGLERIEPPSAGRWDRIIRFFSGLTRYVSDSARARPSR